MLRKLELDALRADLASVEMLLSERSEADDPIGWMQFAHRKQQLEEMLAATEAHGEERAASVAIFFGGRPVIGSRGVLADFGAKAIEDFQSLISTQFAAMDGPLGKRGPIAQRERTQLMITDIARGSLGFVLEEASENGELLDTTLRHVVDDVCDLIYRISSPDEESFEEAAASVDDRMLGSLKEFFSLLDENGATLRVAKEKDEFTVDRDAVERGHKRTDSLKVSQRNDKIVGTLYILPEGKKFEIHPAEGGEIVRGSVNEAALHILLAGGEVKPEFMGRAVVAELKIKEAQFLNRPPRKNIILTNVRSA